MISLDSLIALLNQDEEAETEVTEKKDHSKLIWLIIALIVLYLLTRKR